MKTGYCPKCHNSCPISFVSHVTRGGKIIYPRNGKRCFVIPNCPTCSTKAA